MFTKLIPWLLLPVLLTAAAAEPARGGLAADSAVNESSISVSVNGSLVLDQPESIRRISVANAEIAEAVAVSAKEIVVNGKAVGDTSLIVWDVKGSRNMLSVHVVASTAKITAVRSELLREAGADVNVNTQDGSVFLTGIVADETTANRAYTIASTLGKVVNLLRVTTPASEPQILLRVRFADVDRAAANQLGVNLFTMDPVKGLGTSTTGAFGSPPTFSLDQNTASWNLSSLLNIFYFRPDINLGVVLQDLATRNVLQILAEPNLLTLSGKAASFLAGGEFPFPTIQGGGSGVGQITIQFKEFGVRLNFLPVVTPRGTIRLSVTPEVSSLDYANGLTISGFTIPGLSTRRVQTEIELENGQSFVIAGLLNAQTTEQFSRMPGLANIPILGKLFQSRSVNKTNSELLVMVTPELVYPIRVGEKVPAVPFPTPFLDENMAAPRNPPATTQNGPMLIKRDVIPVEELDTPAQPAAAQPAAAPTNLTLPGITDPTQRNPHP